MLNYVRNAYEYKLISKFSDMSFLQQAECCGPADHGLQLVGEGNFEWCHNTQMPPGTTTTGQPLSALSKVLHCLASVLCGALWRFQ